MMYITYIYIYKFQRTVDFVQSQGTIDGHCSRPQRISTPMVVEGLTPAGQNESFMVMSTVQVYRNLL